MGSFRWLLATVSVVRCLFAHGFDRGTALAVLRFTACLPLRFSGISAEYSLDCRSSGVLTGTRTAGALGRILVAIVVSAVYGDLARHAYQAGERKVVLSTWVDNLYVAAASPVACSAMLQILESGFAQWGVELKPGSVSLTTPAGSRSAVPAGRQTLPDCPCLGATICSDSSHRQVLASLLAKIRGVSFALVKNRGYGFLGIRKRAEVAHRAATPLVDFFVPLLRPSASLARALDAAQFWLCSIALRMIPFAGETAAAFAQRRRWVCSSLVNELGRWSERVCLRFSNWGMHVLRREQYGNPPWYVVLLPWHDATWLDTQRRALGSSGRTGTRVRPGRPSVRFQEALSWCALRIRR